MMDKDVEILRRMLSQAGRWLVHVHSGHIVKVARVAQEMSADAVLDDPHPRVSPKPASSEQVAPTTGWAATVVFAGFRTSPNVEPPER